MASNDRTIPSVMRWNMGSLLISHVKAATPATPVISSAGPCRALTTLVAIDHAQPVFAESVSGGSGLEKTCIGGRGGVV